jgi:sensor histidine kinase YesM
MIVIAWPLMLILRVGAGVSLLPALINILSLTLVLVALVALGIFLFSWFFYNPAASGLRRWIVLALYVALLVTTLRVQVYFSATEIYIAQQSNQMVLWTSLIGSRLIGVGLALYIYFYLLQRKQATETQARVIALELSAREAEIERLRAQINPHFLFNTLTSIAGTTTEPPVEEMAQLLSDVLRYNLSHAGQNARFEEEMKAIESYLQLERMRFGERLQYELEISRLAREAKVSQPVLLPLVENAIKHGFITSPRALRLKIEVSVVGTQFKALVENTGRWIEPIVPAAAGTQIGLNNLKRRLALIYGKRAQVERVVLPDAVRFNVTLPLDAVA